MIAGLVRFAVISPRSARTGVLGFGVDAEGSRFSTGRID
jgi:hypothetical protein